MKAIDALLSADLDTRRGNHAVVLAGNKRKFIYFFTAVCVVDDRRRIFYLDDGGYGKKQSTTRTLNKYRREFLSKGYREVTKEQFEMPEELFNNLVEV